RFVRPEFVGNTLQDAPPGGIRDWGNVTLVREDRGQYLAVERAFELPEPMVNTRGHVCGRPPIAIRVHVGSGGIHIFYLGVGIKKISVQLRMSRDSEEIRIKERV